MKKIFLTILKVLAHPSYLIIMMFCATLLLFLAIWLPNFAFLKHMAVDSNLSAGEKLSFLSTSFSVLAGFPLLSRFLTIIVSMLFGINAALLIFYIKTRFRLERTAGMSIGGAIFGLLGAGCAPCGSVILSSFLGVGATASFVNILPLKGQEFGLVGIAFMFFSIVLTAKKIEQPLFCNTAHLDAWPEAEGAKM